jgi:16S rRNA processing protein RimM
MTIPSNTQELTADWASRMIILGRVSGVFGILGWLKIVSETEPRDSILQYNPWHLKCRGKNQDYRPLAGRIHGKGLIAQLEGCDNRDLAAALVGCEIAVRRDQLPVLEPDDFYWSDLEGLKVKTLDGLDLGQVSHLFSTGANDVIVVHGERERLIPYLWEQVVQKVDLANGLLIVDWDPAF